MITLRSLLPPQAPRAAFGALVKSEFLLAWRTPRLAVGLGLPVLLLVVFGLLPPFQQSLSDLGGLTLFEVYVPVLMALGIAALGFTILPSPLATYREQGILRRLSTTPVPPAWVLGAQLVVAMALAVLDMLILMVVGMAAFGLAAPRSAGGLVLALLLTITAVFALGLCIAAVARGAQMAVGLGGVSVASLMFFAGLWVPRAAMPSVLRDISDWTPLGAAVEALQSALQTGFPPLRSLLVLVAYALVFGWLAVRFFRWE
jgi:ABC-2 type transport system permease protein